LHDDDSSSSDFNTDECASEESLEPVDFHDKKRSDDPDEWQKGWRQKMIKIFYLIYNHSESKPFQFPVDSEDNPCKHIKVLKYLENK
jgi:hypothetical protein